MKLLLQIAIIFFALCRPPVRAADAANLAPNAILSFKFPDLPQTFFNKATHQDYPPMLSARLPENYTREGRFPLFVFLNGGNGGRGDSSAARDIVGPRDFIAVSLPLFRDPTGAKAPPLPGVNTDALVNINDAPVLGSAYRVMLQKLLDTVPNISTERSTLGGFSNGAHAVGALLAAKDPFILDHFTAFCFFEGGMALAMNPAALQQPALRHCRFIMLFGDRDRDPKLQSMRKLVAEPLIDSLARQASDLQLDFTRVVMKGYGHETPPEYQKLLGAWIRGEKLPQLPPK